MPVRNQEKIPPELARLAEGVGRFIQYWGFKSIHGKIWVLLYLSSEPLSAVDLSRKLKVSKTLLSFSIAELLAYNVITEVGKGAKRTVYFRANPNLTQVISNVLASREKPMMTEICLAVAQVKATSAKKLDSCGGIDFGQLAQLESWVNSAHSALNSILSVSQSESLISQFLLISSLFVSKEPHTKKPFD